MEVVLLECSDADLELQTYTEDIVPIYKLII